MKSEYIQNTQKTSDWPKLNGQYQGIQREWYNNGEIYYYFMMKDGLFHGIFQNWLTNHKRYALTVYNKQNQHGINLNFIYNNENDIQ